MSGLMDILFSIGVLILFPLAAVLLYLALKHKEQLISDEALVRLKDNWPRLRIAVVLGTVALFVFLWTELTEVLEDALNLHFGLLSEMEGIHELAEMVMIYLLIFSVAVNLYFVRKIRGGNK